MAYTEGAGPALAILVVGGLVVLSRWVFSTSSRDRRLTAARAASGHGLLVPAVTVPSEDEAVRAAGVLTAVGIRATVAPARPDPTEPVRITADGRVLKTPPVSGHHVLVFPADLERAQAELGR